VKSLCHLPYTAGVHPECVGAIEFSIGKTHYRVEVFPFYIEHDLHGNLVPPEQRLVWTAYRAELKFDSPQWEKIKGFTRAECRSFPKTVSQRAAAFIDAIYEGICWP
jgi:hypothetical protein